jgi:quercetin dioxygenase-like cupin family protein
MASEKFLKEDEISWVDLGGGVQRKIMGFDNQIMMVKVKFEKGSVGSTHQHFHTQTTYCASGKFQFSVEGEESILNSGDGVYIKPNLPHGTVCLEEGILIDVFSPVREDFLDGSTISYFGKK